MTSSILLIVQHHQDESGAWLLGMMEVQMLVLYKHTVLTFIAIITVRWI